MVPQEYSYYFFGEILACYEPEKAIKNAGAIRLRLMTNAPFSVEDGALLVQERQ
jgi:hypothetical protein